MAAPVFSSARKQLVVTLLVAAGSTSLVACKGQEAAYRPAPRYTQPSAQPAPTYTQPYTQPAPTYTQPAPTYPQPVPTQRPGAVNCGNGKCA